MSVEIVSVGHTTIGTDITRDGVEHTSFAGGGLSPAIAAATVLEPSSIGLSTIVGDDELGQGVRSFMSKIGLNTEGVQVVEGGQTTTVVIWETDKGREMAVEPRVSAQFVPQIPASYRHARYAHIGSGPSIQQLEWYNNIRGEFSPNTVISADPLDAFIRHNPAETRALLERVDLIFINQEELALVRAYGELATKVPMVLKCGANGVIYTFGDERISIPAPKVNVVHTTGAGETIAGVYLGLRAQGKPVQSALEQAVLYASISVTDFGVVHLAESIKKYYGN
jgi:sugar/nucleoside kinase (ribokinase family)